ncbi:exosortase/archaeosortase family protein [Actinophytocola sp.]|uniref:exosortase/archaeosortase family protein n=1 Tax=Actinophytocola sp. TaxID=1872138 RepID=UPI002ED13840
MSRRLLAGTLLLAAGALAVWHGAYRTVESVLAGALIRLYTSDSVYVAAERQSVYLGLGGERPFGLRMSPECTSAFVLLPLLVIGAGMIARRPAVTRRVLGALGIATVLLVLLNQLRMLVLVGTVNSFGAYRGYLLGHSMFGSLVSVIGGVAVLVLFVWLATRSPEGVAPGRQRPSATRVLSSPGNRRPCRCRRHPWRGRPAGRS